MLERCWIDCIENHHTVCDLLASPMLQTETNHLELVDAVL